jgi:hypothetical protein
MAAVRLGTRPIMKSGTRILMIYVRPTDATCRPMGGFVRDQGVFRHRTLQYSLLCAIAVIELACLDGGIHTAIGDAYIAVRQMPLKSN